MTTHRKKSSSFHLVDICAHLLRNGLATPLSINRPTLLPVPTSSPDRTGGGELGVNTGGRVRLDADLLRLDLAVNVLVVVALGAGRRGTFGFSHVDADLGKVLLKVLNTQLLWQTSSSPAGQSRMLFPSPDCPAPLAQASS